MSTDASSASASDDNGSTKPVSHLKDFVELLSQALILYAAYSEFVVKALASLRISQAEEVARCIVSGIGIFVLSFVVLSKSSASNGGSPRYRYALPIRATAAVFSLFLLGALIAGVRGLLAPASVEAAVYDSSFEFAETVWSAPVRSADQASTWIFTAPITLPKGTSCTHLKVVANSYRGYHFADVQIIPDPGALVREVEEPLEVGGFQNSRSEWLLPFTQPSTTWRIQIGIERDDKSLVQPPGLPFGVTAYLYDQ